MEIQKVSIIGMGALGLLYGSIIADNCGDDAVQYIMDAQRYERYAGQAFACNGMARHFPIVLDTDAKPADLLLVAVKATGLDAALESMRGSIGPETILISVMNGISSEQRIGERYGFENIIYAVAQGMDAMKFGNALTYMNKGELRIGITETGSRSALERVQRFFDRARVPYVEEADIMRRLWSKFMLNVGINQTCMVYQTDYAGALAAGEANRTLVSAMREVIALANAEGVALSEADINQYMDILARLNPTGMPSMAQDRINRRHSEVESFAGTVLSLAEKHGLYVPVNRYLYDCVREIESEY